MDAFHHLEDLGEVAFDVRSRGVGLDDQTGLLEQFVRALDLAPHGDTGADRDRLELIIMVAQWFPNEEIIVSGDSALRRSKHPLSPATQRSPHQPCASQWSTLQAGTPKKEKRKGPARKKGDRLPGMKQWADDPDRPWTKLEYDQFGLHTTLEVKTIQALYYKAGKDRLLTIVLTRDVEGKRPDQMFYCTKLDWTAREILSAYACRWAIECTFENCKQFLGLEDPANRLPKAVVRTAPMALFIYTLVVIWFRQTGHQLLRFPFRPSYAQKEEPSFADMLTTLRRVSYQEKTPQPLPEQSGLKTLIAQVTKLLSRTG